MRGCALRKVVRNLAHKKLVNDLIPHFEALFLRQLSHHAASTLALFLLLRACKIPGLEGQHEIIKTAGFLA